jgi:hypothetical protein
MRLPEGNGTASGDHSVPPRSTIITLVPRLKMKTAAVEGHPVIETNPIYFVTLSISTTRS